MAAQNAAVHEYEEGCYDDALEHFQDAYRLNAEPSLLLSIAKCRYRLRQYEAAKSCLFDFLRDDPKSVYGTEAFELLTRIEKEAATPKYPATVSCLNPPTAGAEASTGGARPDGTADRTAVGTAGSGASATGAGSPASSETGSVSGTSGSAANGTPSGWPAGTGGATGGGTKIGSTWLGGERGAAGQVNQNVWNRKHGPWSYVALGASVAAAGVGAYFGAKNHSATSDWRAARTPDASAAARDRARSAAQSANISWAATGVLLGTGLGLFFFTQF